MSYVDSIGTRLRIARMRSALQQADVAEKVGVTRVSVSNWERDVAMPTDENLDALAKLYHTTARDLRYGGPDSGPSVPTRVQDPHGVRSYPVPQSVRIWLQELQLELTKEGASDQDIASIIGLLTSSALFNLYGRDNAGEVDETRWLRGLQAFADVARAGLKEIHTATPEPAGASIRVSSKELATKKRKPRAS